MRISPAVKSKREALARAEKQSAIAIAMPEERPALHFYSGYEEKPFYIAVSKHGFGVDHVPAMAIRLAQTEIPARTHESQLLIYRAIEFIEPAGFSNGAPEWPNGTKPKLVGLTSTHRGFQQTPR